MNLVGVILDSKNFISWVALNMKLKQKNIFIVLLFIILIITTFISVFVKDDIKPTPTTTPTELTTSEYKTYIVKEHNGMVAVFQKGQDKPIKITDTYISSLPQPDQKNLVNGIQVEKKEDLRKLLEDLCS